MKDKIEIMLINFGCVDLMDPELIKKFKKQNLKKDGIERLLSKHISHDFKVPEELSNQIDLVEFLIRDCDVQVYNVEEDIISFDVAVRFKFRLLNENAIESIKDYQSKNDDLRANISIFWKTLDGEKIEFVYWWEEDIRDDIKEGDWFTSN